jgi:beta-xylosidase
MFEVCEVIAGSVDSDKYFYPKELETSLGKYRLVARLISTHQLGRHFWCLSYHEKPTPGVYAHNDLVNGGYATRQVDERGFVGRNPLSLVAIYAKIKD